MSKQTGTCCHCGRHIGVSKNGFIANHGQKMQYFGKQSTLECLGSGLNSLETWTDENTHCYANRMNARFDAEKKKV